MSLASDERAAICDEFDEAGPARPTLCAGWTARELLAHLLVRERMPWAAPGILVPALAPLTERAMRSYDTTPWHDMVGLLRAGAPAWSPYRIGRIDAAANGAEFFVHHEDLRRGEPGWEPRDLGAAVDDELWAVVRRMGRLLYRRSPVGVVLQRPSGERHEARSGPRTVTVLGAPGELLLDAFGRSAVRVDVTGEPTAVEALAGVPRGV